MPSLRKSLSSKDARAIRSAAASDDIALIAEILEDYGYRVMTDDPDGEREAASWLETRGYDVFDHGDCRRC